MASSVIKKTGANQIITAANIAFPWIAPSDGIITIWIQAQNIGSQYTAYLYVSRNNLNVGSWADSATGGQGSVAIPVNKGDELTASSNAVAQTRYHFLPID